MAIKKTVAPMGTLPANEIKPGVRLTDPKIWEYARLNNYTIITFDEDFSELQNLYAFPPKIIWLRTGNLTTPQLASLLIKLESDIHRFLADEDLGVFEIYKA